MKYGNHEVYAWDRVTIADRFGVQRTGTANALLFFHDHCILNMGGRYGTPALANAGNIVRVKHRTATINETSHYR